jgi:hypothetical protein
MIVSLSKVLHQLKSSLDEYVCVFLQLAPKEPIGEEFPHEESEDEEKEPCLFDFPPTWVCSFFPGSAFLLTISSHLNFCSKQDVSITFQFL